MRHVSRWAVVICAMLFGPQSARSQGGALTSTVSHVNAAGQGEVKATPDRATIYIGVQSRAVSATASAADNSRRQRAIIDTIKALGVLAQAISTQNYSVNPEIQYDAQGRTSRVTAYVVNNTVRVELQRIDQVSTVIDAALAKGANQINGLEFWSSNADELRRAALAQAVSRARADAEAMARAAGGSLGMLIELSSSFGGPQPLMRRFEAASAMAAQSTPIEPGQQSIVATVNGSWVFVR